MAWAGASSFPARANRAIAVSGSLSCPVLSSLCLVLRPFQVLWSFVRLPRGPTDQGPAYDTDAKKTSDWDVRWELATANPARTR
jgi:hypothetical protein